MSFPPVLTPRAQAPLIETPRLRLRHHTMADFAPFWRFYQSERAQFVSVPQSETQMWHKLASEAGSWALCGYGGWAVDLLDGTCIGQVALIKPPHFPELEIGWLFFEGHDGKGYASESAQAALHWIWANLPVTSVVSYIDAGNARSIALAQRLGAQEDPKAARFDAEDLVYRHVPDADGSPEAYA